MMMRRKPMSEPTYSEQMQEELEPLPDLSEEAEDEILKSTGKIDFTQDSEYIRILNREKANEREN